MRILVTGGAGFIGSHIVEHYQGKAEINVLDNLRSGYKKNLKDFNINFFEGSVNDRKIVREAVKNVDYIFHLAALISVPESFEDPENCIDINSKGSMILLEEAYNAGVKKLCLSSSCAIYGDNPESPKTEDMLPDPKSPYAISKLDGEYYCKIFAENGWLDTACLRYFNVFGPRQDPNSAYAAAIPVFASKAADNDTIYIHGDGEQTRDFVYVKDVVAANTFLAENEYSGVYNIGYGEETSIKELAEKIRETTSSSSKIEYTEEREGDIKKSRASIDKLLSCGFKPSSNFNDGLSSTVDYFIK